LHNFRNATVFGLWDKFKAETLEGQTLSASSEILWTKPVRIKELNYLAIMNNLRFDQINKSTGVYRLAVMNDFVIKSTFISSNYLQINTRDGYVEVPPGTQIQAKTKISKNTIPAEITTKFFRYIKDYMYYKAQDYDKPATYDPKKHFLELKQLTRILQI
jgi:hypothetical protein